MPAGLSTARSHSSSYRTGGSGGAEVSGARPGARYEDYGEYLKRLTDLENIGKSKPGVKECYAFQAGREIRVIVDPGVLDDAASTILAHKIKEEVQAKMNFPGQVKVTVIRELRITELTH